MLAAKQPDASMILKYCVLLASLGLAGPAWAQGVDALPGPVHAATLELRAQAWAFRPGTSTGCAAEAGAGRLAVLDLETGTVVGTHPLDRPASLLVTAPGGQWLVASMPPAPESGSTEADVALLDWIGGGIRSTFHVRVLPSGVAVTDAGLVVVSDSVPMRVPDYFGLIVCYDGLSGVERGFCGNSVGSSVALGVDQRTVFGGEYDTVRQFALDPITGELTIVDYSPQQSYPTAVEYGLHVLPDGQHLVSRGGRLHPGVGMGVVLEDRKSVV